MMLAALLLAGTTPPPLLDGFETAAPWQANASSGVEAKVDLVPGVTGKALRLRYDFRQVAGYAFARRALPIDWPANFRVRLKIRGTGGVNDLQIKFSDASGANVWWVQRRNFRPSRDWQTLELRPRDFSFAWGPSADKTLRRTAAMEVVIVRGRDGGAGEIAIDDLSFEPLPVPGQLPAPRASDPRVIDGNPATAWTGRGGDSVRIDFGGVKSIGGVQLRWTPERGAARYAIEGSDDATRWQTLRTVTAGDGGTDPIALPQTDLRYLRVRLAPGTPAAALAEIETRPPEWGETPNAFIAALAKDAPRGTYPRGFTGEQPYWTLVASDTGATSALIGEDGAIEVAKGGFSIEPFVVADGKTFGWADVTATPSLEDGSLPLPHVTWQAPGWQLDSAAFADTSAPRLMARWRLTNTGTTRRRLRLLLAVRPLQVNAPTQFLGQQGGVSPIGRIAWNGRTLGVTNVPAIAGDPAVTRTLAPLVRPDAVATAPFDRGALAVPLSGASTVEDATGMASATLAYDVELDPGASTDLPMAIPSDTPPVPLDRAGFERAHAATVARWRSLLGGVTITVPEGQRAVADTVRTALAQVLMSRTGPALQPGTRSYDRSWIRDGAMMSDTLLRLGLPEPARTFADWYGTKLFADGKVPCCVDPRGADPVPENDSNGEYIHLVTQLYRFTGDRAALARDWPRIDAARRYMDMQRASERGPGATPLTRGLLPRSISHEAYSAEPQYSLWDDFWGLTGYRDAAFAATVLQQPEAATIRSAGTTFATDIHAAITASTRKFGIDFIPGATSLGDFDATSTTIALDPAGEQDALDPKLLHRTFEKQWDRVMARSAPGADWADYTPYELRNVSAFVRLGWAERANGLLDFYMAGRRPAAWNGWAEVVGRLSREQRFIGDMPHAWVASDFIRAALDLFAYDRIADQALVLGGGLTERWQTDGGSRIRGLHTAYGTLDLGIHRESGALVIDIGGTARPPGGFVIPWVSAGRPGAARVDGRAVAFAKDGLHVAARGRPIRIVVALPR